jgi:hypothetical protein
MFISDLVPTEPQPTNSLKFGDNEIRDIKTAIRDTFKNFVSHQLNYSPIELLGMYKFITANTTNLLWAGPVSGKDNYYVIAVTDKSVLYARTPKPMWGTVIYSQFTQAQMDVFYPNTYRLLDGTPISGTLLNKVINMPILDVADPYKNLPNMTNVYIRGVGTGNTLLQSLPESVSLKSTQLSFSFSSLDCTVSAFDHPHHGTADAHLTRSPSTVTIQETDQEGAELDCYSTHINPSVTKDIHSHNFTATIINTPIISTIASSDVTGIGAKKVIRPTTYNLFAYTRVN